MLLISITQIPCNQHEISIPVLETCTMLSERIRRVCSIVQSKCIDLLIMCYMQNICIMLIESMSMHMTCTMHCS